jgi:hypothetical protein
MEQRASRALEFIAWHYIVRQQSVYLCAVRLNRVMLIVVPTVYLGHTVIDSFTNSGWP